MHKSILVLEESTMVHDLFESALPREYWDWHIEHESTPENYVARAKETLPGIIFLSNRDQKNGYAIAREIRSTSQIKNIPILLLTVAKDKLDEQLLRTVGIQGFLRKPFESATLLEQIEVTLQNQSQQFQKDNRNELENIEVVDEELMGLLSTKATKSVTMESLEEELDPTLQLHPIEAESMLLDDAELTEAEYDDPLVAETYDDEPLLADEYDEPLDVDEYEEEPLLADEYDESIDADDEVEELYELELEDAETTAIELELEEISLDMDEYDQDLDEPISTEPLAKAEAEEDGFMKIAITVEPREESINPVTNLSDTDDIGIMEIEVLPYETPLEEIQFDDDTEMDEYAIEIEPPTEDPFPLEQPVAELEVLQAEPDEMHTPGIGAIVENITAPGDAGAPYTELEIETIEADDIIEIEHADINDVIDDDFESDYESEFDDSGLLEISVEGIDTEIDDELITDEDAFESEGMDSIEELPEDEFDQLKDEDETPLEAEPEGFDDEGESFDDENEDEALLDVEPEDVIVSNLPDEDDIEGSSLDDLQEVEGLDDSVGPESDELEAVIEQEETNNLEFDFEAVDEDGMEDVDAMLEDLEDIDPQNAHMNIQEMINFRQVMKAKYDIPETTAEEAEEDAADDEDLEIDFLSDNEIDDFDTMEASEDAEDLMLEDDVPEEDADLLLDEFDESEDLSMDDASLDEEEEIDIFADVDDDEVGDVDLFADEDEPADEFEDDLPDEDSNLLVDDLEEDDMPETAASDLFDDSSETDDDLQMSSEDDILIDDTGFNEPDDDIFDADGEDDVMLADAPDLEEPSDDDFGEETGDAEVLLEEGPIDTGEDELDNDSDPIDLLSDDLLIEDPVSDQETDDSEDIFDDMDSEPIEEEPFASDGSDESEIIFEEEDDSEVLLEDVDDPFSEAPDETVDEPFDSLEESEAEPDLLLEDDMDFSTDDMSVDDMDDDLLLEDDHGDMEESLLEDSETEEDLLLDDTLDEVDDGLLEDPDDDTFSEAGDEPAGDDDLLLIDENSDADDSFEEVELSETAAEMPSAPFSEPDTADEMEDMAAISEADEVAIEVPQDVFEISDMKMSDLADDVEADSEKQSGDTQPEMELLEAAEEAAIDEPEMTEDIELPSMDEDLPDLPSVFDEEEDEDSLLLEDEDLPDDFEMSEMDEEEDLLAEPVDEDEAADDEITILQSEEDFDSFPDESDTIGFKEEPAPTEETSGDDAQVPEPEAAPAEDQAGKKKALSPDLRDKLSGMIENAISETIQTTLHDMLPDMMDQIIQEELED